METKSNMMNILEWIGCIIVALAIGSLLKFYLFTPTMVYSHSMDYTLEEGQRLILDRTIRIHRKVPNRGEIVTFEAPSNQQTGIGQTVEEHKITASYEKEPKGIIGKFFYYIIELGKTSYIKRVIGLPGEHVKIENGKVYINGKELEEPYLGKNVVTDARDINDFTVPEGYVFLMGDNRQHSNDCRNFGCIPIEKLEGKVWVRIWPFNKFGKVN